tara:strand:- start:2912 stop:4165 length:1254 start_codon:yes stop_codon:yes gene_type:complete
MLIKDWSAILTSLFYFIKLIFVTKKYDLVFVSSNYFNRGNNDKNLLFEPMIESCIKNKLNFIILEDTDLKGEYQNFRRSNNSIPFDFITLLQVILRKCYDLRYKKPTTEKDLYLREFKISKILKKFFFRKFTSKVYITLLWNNVTLWRTVDPDSCVIDYQHGIIFNGHDGYIKDDSPPNIKSRNNVHTFVHGNIFKKILINGDKSGFYRDNNVINIGLKKVTNTKSITTTNSKKILFSLQIVPDFTDEVIYRYIDKVKKLLDFNAEFFSKNDYKIIFKHHPRYTSKNCPEINFEYDFIELNEEKSIENLLNSVDLHMTFHSTSAIDAAMMGIPTIFIDMHEQFSPYEIFINQYKYPLKNYVVKDLKDLQRILVILEDKQIYSDSCNTIYSWSRELASNYNEDVFKNFIFGKIKGNSK